MRLRRRKETQPELVADPCLGDPTARRLFEALAKRNWSEARAVLAAAEHPDDRTFYLEVCGAVPGVQNWIGHFAGDDPLAQLVRGAHAVQWAWDARGGYQAQYTAEDRFVVFFERLRIAESALYDVVRADPDEVSAWAFLIRTARGLQLPLEDGEYRYVEATKRFPFHWKANFEWMQTQCEKWYGSEERMHRFAREVATRAPGGSMIPALVALAHLETTLPLNEQQLTAYMTRADVRADLRTAAGHSIWHPGAVFRPDAPQALNIFAMAFTLSEDPAAAAPVFAQLGDQPTAVPWGYLPGSYTHNFQTARTRVTQS
ncbi:hypothetical protein [Kribbella shirazensis]|uniref:DUF4034 domain-containing protein n=1 Tax=Kribbella shirazensis TaxID=1105143 RepID=A0A7X5V6J3_9ACTN|nr:hypothetical protein [Kribbella shirazensis]NIK55126.1 hypothetical protein [Kribbella shirazensis]